MKKIWLIVIMIIAINQKILHANVKKDDDVIIYPGASSLVVNAKEAIIIDYHSGTILLAKNANEKMPPSSMTKIMTTYLLEESILSGKISNETEFRVSEHAWRAEGSRMFVNLNSSVKVADLHKGIAVQSGNDACRVVAEGMLGSEAAFAVEMNLKAKELGMINTHFTNTSGLPDQNHYSTAKDLALLAQASIKHHPSFYHINSIKEFTYNGIKQGNRNPLLYDDPHCDGIKTGHTDAGGYGMVASCTENSHSDQRYILVINGLASMSARADEAKKLIAWARANFTNVKLAKKGDIIDHQAKVSLGIKENLPLIVSEDLNMFTLRLEQKAIKLEHDIKTNLIAPINEGDICGSLTAVLGDKKIAVNLLAQESIAKLGWFKRILKYVKII